MTERKLTHSTFTLEREYKASPARVFQAFADPVVKATWFDAPSEEWRHLGSSLDFREGGREHSEGQFGEGGPVSRFDAYYHEVVDDLRLVYDYEMRVNGQRLSVSLASIELTPTAAGTRLTLTEQGVYFDDLDNTEQRKEGTIELLESLAKAVED
ncbi:polyketide cyclase [Diaminobutyricibacter tongyongensis]|uniref:Polyketide cyclase n=1 Tax=Leifsonia tongyongensis TaxID=1268043 RepID=A0A6L9XVS9_9MICO|nr:SRPBCC family protein [Diaminobutyricibacter tongyongensis]NEN05134.1 polyketide cyclase [Diaminobutyricibacter tongyongensis]